MQYWLMKSEPDVYGIDHLIKQKRKTDHWDGIRNYQARNFMRDGMKKGDKAFFYHSSCPEPGIAGIMEIAREAYVDPTQFDPEEKYYDPKSTRENPRWLMVDVRFLEKFDSVITLKALKANPALEGMRLLQKGTRLSIMPVSTQHWNTINGMRE